MCQKCYGKGYSVKEVIPGAFSFAPCDCEYAEIARQQAEEKMMEFKKRLCEAKERLKMEVSV
jgi:hypothetical protein